MLIIAAVLFFGCFPQALAGDAPARDKGAASSAGQAGAPQSASSLLAGVHAYPNPFKKSQGVSSVTFTNLPAQAEIRIYTVSGELVRDIGKNDSGSTALWDLNNAAGSRVASGLYLYMVDSGGEKIYGKLLVIW
ncbi:MAG: T9SS type A sorting domain-containing protein [Elusimicrobiales bacterium]